MKIALTVPQISCLVSDSEKREGGKGDSGNINCWICNFLKIKKVWNKYDKMWLLHFRWWVHRYGCIFLCDFWCIKRNDHIRKCLSHKSRQWMWAFAEITPILFLLSSLPTMALNNPQSTWLHSCWTLPQN